MLHYYSMSECGEMARKTTHALLGAYKSRIVILRPKPMAIARKQFVIKT